MPGLYTLVSLLDFATLVSTRRLVLLILVSTWHLSLLHVYKWLRIRGQKNARS